LVGRKLELASNPSCFKFFGPLWNKLQIFEIETQWFLKATPS